MGISEKMVVPFFHNGVFINYVVSRREPSSCELHNEKFARSSCSHIRGFCAVSEMSEYCVGDDLKWKSSTSKSML